MSGAQSKLRSMLLGHSCTTCSGPLDEHCHRCLLLRPDGAMVKHLICSSCGDYILDTCGSPAHRAPDRPVETQRPGYFRAFFSRLAFFFASFGSGGVASIRRSKSSVLLGRGAVAFLVLLMGLLHG
jgi:hypothetical protein